MADFNNLYDDTHSERKISINSMRTFLSETENGHLYAIDSPASSSGYGGGTSSGLTVREQDDQLQMLHKENFHLKLRIYFLQQTQIARGNEKSISFDSTQADRENLELKITAEVLRSELQEKQMLICEAAMAMEHMERVQKQQADRSQEQTNQLNQRINELESQIDERIYESQPVEPLDLSTTNDFQQRITDLQCKLAKYEKDILNQTNHTNDLNEQISQKNQCIQDLQLKINRLTYTVDELREHTVEKDAKIRQLEEFRSCAKKAFASQMEKLSIEQDTLYDTIEMLQQKINQYEFNGSVFDNNLRIISEQRRLMQDLHDNLETKKMSLNDLRRELATAEHELLQIRSEKDLLLNQLDLINSNTNMVTYTKSTKGFTSIQERSEEEMECGGTAHLMECTQHTCPRRAANVISSDSSLFRKIWKIERVTQRDGFFTAHPTQIPLEATSTNIVKHTQSMQSMPIIMNPIFAQFNNDLSAPSVQHHHGMGATVLASRLPIRKTISLEIPNRLETGQNKLYASVGATAHHARTNGINSATSTSIVSHGLKYLFDRMKKN